MLKKNQRSNNIHWKKKKLFPSFNLKISKKLKFKDYTNHYWWQGKFYSKSGRDPRFQPFTVCGKGNVQGIVGVNCRHSYGPGDGVFNPYEHYDNEENKKAYELSQKQRTIERRIRQAKRELMALKQGVEDCKDPETAEEIKTRYDKKKKRLLILMMF